MTSPFKDYSRYYSAFYQAKPYAEEARFVLSLIKELPPGAARKWVDLGCGTGRHATHFAAAGWQVHGVDASAGMIEEAQKQIPEIALVHASLQDFQLPTPATVASSLFHVMSYQVSDSALTQALENIRRNLVSGGWFVFDFWHGVGVLRDPPAVRVRRTIFAGKELTRIGEPDWRPIENRIDVNYELLVSDPGSKETVSIRESHAMRYFFVPELRSWLAQAGFEIETVCKWLSPDPLEPDDWYGTVVARAC